MRSIATFVLSALICASASGSDLDDFKAVLEGRYDNELQVFFEKDQAKPGAASREHRHVVFRKSKDGEYEVQIMSGAHADHPLEQAWTVSPGKGGVVTTISGDMEGASRACTAVWVRDGSGFKVSMDTDCRDGIVKPGARFGADGLEGGARNDGLPPDQFKRIRPFECWVAVLRGAKHGDSGKGAKDTDWFFKRGVWIHDQGGLATVTTDEMPSRDIRLRLRRVAWPSGPNRPSLTLYVLPPGEDDRAVSYAWGEFDAARLGLNLRWMQASCTHAPDKVFP